MAKKTTDGLTVQEVTPTTWMESTLNTRGQTLYNQMAQQYTQRSDEELADLAAAKYTPVYNAEVEAANNNYAQQLLNYNNTVTDANKAYDRQIAANAAQYAQGRDTLTGTMLQRGMGRSSYANALLYNNGLQEASSANAIEQNRTDTLNQAQSALSQAATENTNTLGRLKADLAQNILSYVDQLEQQEYERQQAAAAQNASIVQWLLDGSKNYSRYAKKSSSSKKKTTSASKTTGSSSSTGTASSAGTASSTGAGAGNAYSGLTLLDTIKNTYARYGLQ